jgi:hypothetical protein
MMVMTRETVQAKPALTLIDAELQAWGRAVQIEYELWVREQRPGMSPYLRRRKPSAEECLEALEGYLSRA